MFERLFMGWNDRFINPLNDYHRRGRNIPLLGRSELCSAAEDIPVMFRALLAAEGNCEYKRFNLSCYRCTFSFKSI